MRPEMRSILVTGPTGLVGRRLVEALSRRNQRMRLALRRDAAHAFAGTETVLVGAIGRETDWEEALRGINTVIHLAGVTPRPAVDAREFETVNDFGTLRLVEQCQAAGIARFIYISSINAVAGGSTPDIITDATIPNPVTPYGASKLAAERHVATLAETAIEAVSLRPPLVYDARAVGNWQRLMRLADTGLPLPLGAMSNCRSLIGLDELVGAIMQVALADRILSGVYCIADSAPVSTTDIITSLRLGMKRSRRLFALPSPVVSVIKQRAMRSAPLASLFGDLEIDSSRFRTQFGWSQNTMTLDGLIECGRAFAALQARSGA